MEFLLADPPSNRLFVKCDLFTSVISYYLYIQTMSCYLGLFRTFKSHNLIFSMIHLIRSIQYVDYLNLYEAIYLFSLM